MTAPQARWIALALAVTCCATAAPAQEQGVLVRGTPAGTWLVLQDTEGYRVAYAAPGKAFSPAGATLRGRVTAATTVGDGLVVFFRGGSYERYFEVRGTSQPGVRPDGTIWPADALALSACPGEKPDEFYVLIRLGTLAGSADAPATASAPAHAGTAASPAKTDSVSTVSSLPRRALPRQVRLGSGHYLRLLRYDGAGWNVVSTLQVEAAENVALLACQGGQTYLLLASPGRGRLVTLAGGLPVAAAPLPPDGEALDLAAMDKHLTLTWLDGPGRLWLARWEGQRWSAPTPVRGDVPAWTGQKPRPSLGQSGQELLAAWRDGVEVKACTISPEGKSGTVEIIDLQAQATLDKALDALRMFIGGVMMVMFLLVFWSGQPVRTAPFSLPPHMVPARLPRRLAATIIDLVPFSVAAAVVLTCLGVPPPSNVMLPSAPFVYASIAMTATFLVYSIVMEAAFGATVGKKLLGLRVVGDRGGRLTLREAVVRGCSKAVEMSFLPLLLFAILTRYRQRLGDKMAWTAVVALRKVYPPPPPPLPEDEPDSTADEESSRL